MTGNILQPDVTKRGLVLDPRTKLFLLFTMTFFVLGFTGGEILNYFMPAFCIIPAIALLSAGKYKMTASYVIIYSLAVYITYSFNETTTGLMHFLIFGSCAIITRILPCLMTGAYMMSTTTVSEFTAAMLKMHVSEKVIIPLSVMFRFFPTVMDEYRSISAAMRMRDIRLGGKNVLKMAEYRLVPLMTSCARIGEELSAAALTRGLGGECRRTNICKIGFQTVDKIVILLCIVPYGMLVLDLFGIM